MNDVCFVNHTVCLCSNEGVMTAGCSMPMSTRAEDANATPAGHPPREARLYPEHIKLSTLQKSAVAILSAVGAAMKYATDI